MIYCFLEEATTHQAMLIKRGLEDFCRASGQKVTFSKYHLHFSPNVLEEESDKFSSIPGIPCMNNFGKYLGFHLLHNGRSNQPTKELILKAHDKMAGWKQKCTSKTRKIMLAASVLNSLTTFYMQIIDALKSTYES